MRIYKEGSMDKLHNKHYVRTDAEKRIIRGFSDSFEQPQDGDICINEQGSYQFRLFPNGEENPPLFTNDGVSLYKWDGKAVKRRADKEIETETNEINFENLKKSKFKEVGMACTGIIHTGITVGDCNYSLETYDQINLMGQLDAIQQGAEAVPYHANGNLCRMFPAAEFVQIAEKAISHVFLSPYVLQSFKRMDTPHGKRRRIK
jgi:hypothetical protein